MIAHRLALGSIVLSLGLGLALCGCEKKESAATTAPAGKTLENLQAAYNGESNAHARYVAFAIKADEEGYHQVASLFRATARSEEIHAANHAAAIKKLGAVPKADLQPPKVATTRENLAAALQGETYEIDTMYPQFAEQAQNENQHQAHISFSNALAGEKMHAKFYQDALNNLDQWKDGTREFLVCDNCGYTTQDMSIANCPLCGVPRNRFDAVK